MKRALLAACAVAFPLSSALLLSGCETAASPPPVPAVTDAPLARAEVRAYAQCNAANARRFAALSGDVLSLAIAAEGACGPAKRSLTDAIAARFGLADANRMVANLEEQAVRTNAGAIARLKAG